MNGIEIGKVCVVRERTKLKDKGSYVGVIVSVEEEETVYVMNEDGVYPTRSWCILTKPEDIKAYYEELKKEHSRIHKLAEKYCDDNRELYRIIHSTTDNWTNYIKGIVSNGQKPMKKDKAENLIKLAKLREKKGEVTAKYWDYYWYLDKLLKSIKKYIR